jgi:methylated-DNA-[protein]-cysteine S-methyltransferase
MTACTATIATPAGPFTIVADDANVLASGWTSAVDDLLGVIHPSLRPSTVEHRRPRPVHRGGRRVPRRRSGGDRRRPRHADFGPFLVHAWKVLRTAAGPSDHIRRVRASAATLPPPRRRAARNAAALFVPCHRVAHRERWWLPLGPEKRWLLDHESPRSSL